MILSKVERASKRKATYDVVLLSCLHMNLGEFEVKVEGPDRVEFIYDQNHANRRWEKKLTANFLKNIDAFLDKLIGKKRKIYQLGYEVSRDDWKNGSVMDRTKAVAIKDLMRQNKWSKEKATKAIESILADPENVTVDMKDIPSNYGGVMFAYEKEVFDNGKKKKRGK